MSSKSIGSSTFSPQGRSSISQKEMSNMGIKAAKHDTFVSPHAQQSQQKINRSISSLLFESGIGPFGTKNRVARIGLCKSSPTSLLEGRVASVRPLEGRVASVRPLEGRVAVQGRGPPRLLEEGRVAVQGRGPPRLLEEGRVTVQGRGPPRLLEEGRVAVQGRGPPPSLRRRPCGRPRPWGRPSLRRPCGLRPSLRRPWKRTQL